VKPSEVEIEITESVLIEDFDKVFEKLKILKDYGIRVSLDDFGTGFSSLSYLKKLPIDTLKIDKSFIDTVLADGATRIITESIINMVKSLGIESIAEGVEDDAQYNYLHAIGCDVIQGYLLGKPQPAEEIDSLLKNIL
jgi:EAL domain-containing protein (putative c-di-GMP-specific phosphodiesterase class I)